MTVRTRVTIITVLGFVATAGLSGCGVRGKLRPPPGEKVVTTDHVPSESPKHRPFILDGLVK